MSRADLALTQWQREMPGLDLLPMGVVARLGEATRLVSRDHLDPFFANHGLQPGEFDVLATLRRSGAPYALGPTQLFETLMISSGGMTNRLDRLENAGLIARAPNPDDRRGVLVSLSAEGLALINELLPLHLQNEAGALAVLTRSEQESLQALLAKLIDGLDPA